MGSYRFIDVFVVFSRTLLFLEEINNWKEKKNRNKYPLNAYFFGYQSYQKVQLPESLNDLFANKVLTGVTDQEHWQGYGTSSI